jgi:hypothetical protein
MGLGTETLLAFISKIELYYMYRAKLGAENFTPPPLTTMS